MGAADGTEFASSPRDSAGSLWHYERSTTRRFNPRQPELRVAAGPEHRAWYWRARLVTIRGQWREEDRLGGVALWWLWRRWWWLSCPRWTGWWRSCSSKLLGRPLSHHRRYLHNVPTHVLRACPLAHSCPLAYSCSRQSAFLSAFHSLVR